MLNAGRMGATGAIIINDKTDIGKLHDYPGYMVLGTPMISVADKDLVPTVSVGQDVGSDLINQVQSNGKLLVHLEVVSRIENISSYVDIMATYIHERLTLILGTMLLQSLHGLHMPTMSSFWAPTTTVQRKQAV